MNNNQNSQKSINRVLIFTLHSQQALHVIRALSRVGIKCYVITDKRIQMHRFSRHCKTAFYTERQYLEDGSNELVNDVNNYIKKMKIDLLIGSDGDTTRMLIKHRDQWNGASIYPSPDLVLFDKLHNKWNFAELLKSFNLPQPKYQLISRINDFDDKILSFPILLKPLVSAGGIGIQKIDNYNSLSIALNELKRLNKLPILAQEYIDGEDIDFNVLSNNGNIITWGVQQRISSQKGLIRFSKHEEVFNICNELIFRSKYTGVGHIDLRIDHKDGRVKFIEFNPRFWGSLDYSTAMGLNYPFLGIQMISDKSKNIFEPVIGDCPYLPISLAALLRKILGKKLNIEQNILKEWTTYLWRDPIPELFEDIQNRLFKKNLS